MSLSLGELLLQLRIDPTAYYQQLERARLAAVRSGTEIERSLNLSTPKFSADGYAAVHRDLDLVGKHWTQTGNLMQAKPLTPTVDDRALTALNDHVDQKQEHWIEAWDLMDSNPLTPTVDDRALTDLNACLSKVTTQHQDSVAVVAANVIQPIVNTDSVTIAQLKVTDFVQQLTSLESKSAVEIKLKAQHKVDTSNLDASFDRAADKFGKRGDQVGEAIAKRVSKTSVTTRSPGGLLGSLVGSVAKGGLYSIGEKIAGGTSQALERNLNQLGLKLEKAVTTKAAKQVVLLSKDLGYKNTREFRQDVGRLGGVVDEFIDPAKSRRGAQKAEKALSNAAQDYFVGGKSIKEVGKNFVQEIAPPSDGLKEVGLKAAGVGLRVASPALRINKDVQLARQAKEVERLAEEMELADEYVEQVRQYNAAVFAIGGMHHMEGRGGAEIVKPMLERVMPGAYVEGLSNKYRDSDQVAPQGIDNFIGRFKPGTTSKDLLKKLGLDRVIPPEILKMLDTAAFSGATPEVVEGVAKAKALRNRGIDAPIAAVGYSAGGYDAADFAALAEMVGVEAKGVGVGAPVAGIANRPNKNFQAILGTNDHIYRGLFGSEKQQKDGLNRLIKDGKTDEAKSFQDLIMAGQVMGAPMAGANIVQGAGIAHKLSDYLANPAVQGILGGSIPGVIQPNTNAFTNKVVRGRVNQAGSRGLDFVDQLAAQKPDRLLQKIEEGLTTPSPVVRGKRIEELRSASAEYAEMAKKTQGSISEQIKALVEVFDAGVEALETLEDEGGKLSPQYHKIKAELQQKVGNYYDLADNNFAKDQAQFFGDYDQSKYQGQVKNAIEQSGPKLNAAQAKVQKIAINEATSPQELLEVARIQTNIDDRAKRLKSLKTKALDPKASAVYAKEAAVEIDRHTQAIEAYGEQLDAITQQIAARAKAFERPRRIERNIENAWESASLPEGSAAQIISMNASPAKGKGRREADPWAGGYTRTTSEGLVAETPQLIAQERLQRKLAEAKKRAAKAASQAKDFVFNPDREITIDMDKMRDRAVAVGEFVDDSVAFAGKAFKAAGTAINAIAESPAGTLLLSGMDLAGNALNGVGQGAIKLLGAMNDAEQALIGGSTGLKLLKGAMQGAAATAIAPHVPVVGELMSGAASGLAHQGVGAIGDMLGGGLHGYVGQLPWLAQKALGPGMAAADAVGQYLLTPAAEALITGTALAAPANIALKSVAPSDTKRIKAMQAQLAQLQPATQPKLGFLGSAKSDVIDAQVIDNFALPPAKSIALPPAAGQTTQKMETVRKAARDRARKIAAEVQKTEKAIKKALAKQDTELAQSLYQQILNNEHELKEAMTQMRQDIAAPDKTTKRMQREISAAHVQVSKTANRLKKGLAVAALRKNDIETGAIDVPVVSSEVIKSADPQRLARVSSPGIFQQMKNFVMPPQASRVLSENAESTFKAFYVQAAKVAKVDTSKFQAPQIKVDEKLLNDMGTDAFYDIENNLIIVKKSVERALESGETELHKHTKKLEALTHEIAHSFQTEGGKLSTSEAAGRKDYRYRQTVNAKQRRQVQASVEAARRQNPKADLNAIEQLETDAYAFEDKTARIARRTGSKAIVDRGRKAALDAGGKAAAGLPSFIQGGVSRVAQFAEGGISSIANLGKAAIGMTAGFVGLKAVAFVADIIKDIVGGASEAALEMERLTRIINFTSGGADKGAAALGSLRSEANRLGLDLKSSMAGYASFSASTKDTPLEGDQTMSVFKNVSQASANYGLTGQSQDRVFTAISQMASKGVVSMEELRQQLGESLPGALSVAARSMGMTTKEFSKMVERGEVLSSDFLPKFAMQLGAESSVGVNGAAKSTQASLNRLNNTIFELQATVGKGLLGAQKIGADVMVVGIQKLVGVLELLLKILPTVSLMFAGKFVAGLMAGKAIIPFLLEGLAKIGPKLLGLLPTIATFLAKFILIQAAFESLKAIGDVLTDNGGKFGEFADSARKGLDDYKAALAEANQSQVEFTKNLPTNIKDVKGGSTLGGTIVGSAAKLLFGDGGKDFVDGVENNVLRGLGMTTRAEHNAANRDIRMSDMIKSGAESRLSIVQQIKGPNSNLNQVREIDTQLESVQGRRRALAVTSPNDKDGLRNLKKQEDDLLSQRERLSKPVATLQQANAAEIEMYKASIKELKQLAHEGEITQGDYEKNIYGMTSALETAQKSQDELNKAIKTSVNSLESFERAWASIINRLEDANFALKRTGDESRKAIALAELGGGTQGSSNRSSEILQQEQLRLKIEATRAAIAQMRAELDVQDVATVQTNFNINDQTGPNEIKTLADRATGPKEKAILERLSQLKTMEGEVIGFDADLAEAQVAAKRRLIDLTKQVQEFYRGIERQAQEAALDAKAKTLEITASNAKNRLKAALTGMQDNYISQYVDGLINLVDQMQETMKIAIRQQQEELGKVNSQQDLIRQASELSNQLPNGSEGMGAGGAGTSAGASIGSPVGKGVDTSSMNLWSTGGGSEMISNSNQLRPHHNMRGAYDSRSDATYNSLGQVVSDMTFEDKATKSTSVAIPAPVTGTVVSAGLKGGYGNAVLIREAQTGEEVLLGHLKSISVKAGQQITEGMAVGIQGGTGKGGAKTMDDHLHLEASKAITKRYADSVIQGKYKGIVGKQEQHYEGDGHDHGSAPNRPMPQGGQKHVVIPLDHTRTRIPDKTGGNTYSGSGQTGAAYKGYTERDFQDMLAAKAKAQLEQQGFKVTVLKPESFKSFEQYDSVIAKLSKQAGTTVTPLHYDARMSGYSGGYLTRSRAGDAADGQLSDAIFRNMKAQVGSGASSKFVGKDTEANATIKAAAAAPATLVEFGAMADLVDRYGSVDKYAQSQEFKKALNGYVGGVSQFYGGGQRPQQQSAQVTPRGGSMAGQISYAQVEQMMKGGGNSTIAKLVGMAEGNRRVDGSYTSDAKGHIDQGNRKANMGSFSAQGDFNRGSIEASDRAVIDELLRPNLKRLFDKASRSGVAVTPKLMMNYIDTLNQGGEAVGTGWSDGKSTGKGFLGKLEMVKGRENDDAAIKQLRMESYRNTAGRREVAAIFSDPQRMSEDQERRMGHINKAMTAFNIATPSSPPPGMMMPTTGMTQGQVQSYEFDAAAYAGLQGEVKKGLQLSEQTTNQAIALSRDLAKTQQVGAAIDANRSSRKLRQGLKEGGRETQDQTLAITRQIEDIESTIGVDTPNKGFKKQVADFKRQHADLDKTLSRKEEKDTETLADLRAALPVVESLVGQGLLPTENLTALKAQLPILEGVEKQNKANRQKLNTLSQKQLADIKEKYQYEQKSRDFQFNQELSAGEIAKAQAQSARLRAEAEVNFTDPAARTQKLKQAASLDRNANASQAKQAELAEIKKLQDDARNDPQTYTPERVTQRLAQIKQVTATKLKEYDTAFKTTIEDLEKADLDRAFERTREGVTARIKQLAAAAEALDIAAKDEKLLTNDPIKAIGFQQQAADKRNEAAILQNSLDLSEQIKQQEDLGSASGKTKQEIEQAIQALIAQSKIDLSNLKAQQEAVTAELQRQTKEIEYQSKARVFEVGQELGAEEVKKLREVDGNGIGAIDRQQVLDLGNVEFDLTAKLRNLDMDKMLTPESKAQMRDQYKKMAEMRSNGITINADLAREDNEFQSKTLLFNAAMQANSAKGNYARTLGFESQARDADKAGAIAQEQYNLADGLRKIDEQARSLGLAPEVVEQLKTQLESLNQVNLKNINAQFNPMVDALKSVKGAFQGFMGDIISGNETIGDAFNKMVDNILQSLSALAAQLITEQLFGSLFGLGKGGGGGEKGGKGGGGIGGIFASIFGMADGGVVPSIGQGNMRDRPDAVGMALRKEGPNSVLAALTPGERVLSRVETQRFYGLGLNRWVERPSTTLARVASSERAQKVYNFAMGGVVPGATPIAPGAAANIGNTINVPVQINGGGGQNPGINVPRLRDAIRAEILEEFRRQRRPRSEFG